ncbi:hypothetical protein IP88_00090 [alpha proteobacterium AAP81b]|nr:hypothetical protein IP88_00090 [alpha proteobacterium AAP81b]
MSAPPSRPAALIQCTLGVGALCGIDAIVKHVAIDHAILTISFGRYLAGTLFALIVWVSAGRPAIRRAMLPAHLGRGILIAVMASLFYFGLSRLGLAETITISFIAPLLVPPLARLFLGESMQPRFVAAGGLGFVGVLVTTGGIPDLGGDRAIAVAAVLLSAALYAGAAIILRARAASDGAVIVTLLAAAVPMLVLAPFGLAAPAPTLAGVGWLLAMGVIGNIGVQLMSRAYVHVEAQAAAVVEFAALPFAALFGWAFFAEPVALRVWIGAAIIAAACLWAARGERPAAAAPGEVV